MLVYKYNNIDEALVNLSSEVMRLGVDRETRGFNCVEFPEPVCITITNPKNRIVYNPIRKWNSTLPVAESFAMLAGVNSLSLPGTVVKNLYTYSDDGQFMRAGYGPRIRAFTGASDDYTISQPKHRMMFSGSISVTDQLKYVVELLIKDPSTRQASITMHDPAKDCFKETKDIPCTRLMQFMIVDGMLDMTVYMRSNDLLWGFSAVNVFNFTLMQEMIANLIGVPLGKYIHIVNNLHIYENGFDMVYELSQSNLGNYPEQPFYKDLFKMPFKDFDFLLTESFNIALGYTNSLTNGNPYAFFDNDVVGVDIFDDMILNIYNWCLTKNSKVHGK